MNALANGGKLGKTATVSMCYAIKVVFLVWFRIKSIQSKNKLYKNATLPFATAII